MDKLNCPVDVWWYVCTLCHRAYTKNRRARVHKRDVHPNSSVGLKNVLIMSQIVDLGVTIKVQRWSNQLKSISTRTTEGAQISRKSKVKAKAQNGHTEVTVESEVPNVPDPKQARYIVVKEEVLSQCGDNDNYTADADIGLDWSHDQDQDHGPIEWEGQPSPLEEEQELEDRDDSDPDWLGSENDNADNDIDHAKPKKGRHQEENEVTKVKLSNMRSKRRSRAGRPNQSRKRKKVSQKKSKSNPNLNENGKEGGSSESTANIEGPGAQKKDPAADLNCPVCNKVQISIRDLKRHQREVHGGDGDSREHICSTCGAPFKKSSQLRNHLRTHDPANNKPFICKVCAKPFYTEFLLLRHSAMHEPPKIACTVEGCGKMFRHDAALRKHNKRIHCEERPYKCDNDNCGASFKLLALLRLHASVHAEGRPFSCPQCPNTFKSQPNLHSHVKRVHRKSGSGTKAVSATRFTCHICGLVFPGQKSLWSHQLKVHDFQRGPLRYSCEDCDLKFSHAYLLHQHNEKHNGERPHMCETCGKTFKTSGTLRQHLFFHVPVEERRHVCNVCHRRFALADCLRKHNRIYHSTNDEDTKPKRKRKKRIRHDHQSLIGVTKTDNTDKD